MHLPIEYTGNKYDLLNIKELREYWARYELFDNNEQAINKFFTFIDKKFFKTRITIKNFEYRNVFVGWRWRQKYTDESYHNLISKIIDFFQLKLPHFTKFIHSYKNFTNFCIDYHYMLLLILQKSNSVSNNYIVLSLFNSQSNKQHERHNGNWLNSIKSSTVDSFLLDYMDYTHLGIGLTAIYIFLQENYLNYTDVRNLINSFVSDLPQQSS